MSMKSLIQRNVSVAFKQLGDLLQDVSYIPVGTFDPATGATTTPAAIPAKAVVTLFHRKEIDGTVVLSTDRKAIFELAPLTFELKTGGSLSVGSIRYKIVDVMEDPAGATLTVHLRR